MTVVTSAPIVAATTGPTIQAPAWTQPLSFVSWVNSVAISEKGDRVIAATFIHDFDAKSKIYGQYGTFCFDSIGSPKTAVPKWANKMTGWGGLFAVGISGDGAVAASGGYFSPPFAGPNQTTGLLMIFDAAKGTVLFNSSASKAPIDDMVNVVSLSRDGGIVAAAADQLYVYAPRGATYAPVMSSAPTGDPDFHTFPGPVTAVAVHPTGKWLAACNDRGQLLVAKIEDDVITRTFVKEVPRERVNPNSPVLAPVRFTSVAVSGNDDAEVFVAGGSDVVYRGTVSDMEAGTSLERYDAGSAAAPIINPAPPDDVTDAKARQNIRWTAVSGDGATFATVANRNPTPGPGNVNSEGELLIFDLNASKIPTRIWLEHNPNSVSMAVDGKLIAVADGNPPGNPGLFYLFDVKGKELWRAKTPNMNWPIVVSADGSGIAAGGDDGRLYYFVP